jgi:hypothetical protein
VKCFYCENEARAVCQFCGRGVCRDHAKTAVFHSGFGQKIKDNLWPSGLDTGVTVKNAVWCGLCSVEYQRTH